MALRRRRGGREGERKEGFGGRIWACIVRELKPCHTLSHSFGVDEQKYSKSLSVSDLMKADF